MEEAQPGTILALWTYQQIDMRKTFSFHFLTTRAMLMETFHGKVKQVVSGEYDFEYTKTSELTAILSISTYQESRTRCKNGVGLNHNGFASEDLLHRKLVDIVQTVVLAKSELKN